MATNQDVNTVPPTPNAPPAPPVSQLGAGGNPPVAPPTAPASVTRPPASSSPQTSGKTVLMVGPDGSDEYISYEKVAENLAHGAELGVRMTGPDGSKAIIPFSKKDVNQQNGATWDVSPDNTALKDYATGGLIKQKYGLPVSADLTKPYFDPANAAVKDPYSFSQAYEEFNPPTHTTMRQKVWNYLSNVTKPYEGAMAPRTPEEMVSPAEWVAFDAAGEAAAPTVTAAVTRFNPFRARLNAARAVASTLSPVDAAVEGSLAKPISEAGIPAGSPATQAPAGDEIQPNLQAGIRSTVNQAATAHGFNEIPASTPIRDVPKALGDQAYARSKATFDAAQAATGIDFTALKQNIFKLDDQISDMAITDPEKAGQLLQQKLAYEAQADAGMKAAAEKGVNVTQARSDWNLQLRADELSKHLRNSAEGPLSNPTINPSKFTPRLQKMNEAEVGEDTPKLKKLLGDDPANQLVTHAENAREQAAAIKDFESVPPKDAVAVTQMAKAQATTSPSGKVSVDWRGVLQKFDEMSNDERNAQFTRPSDVRAVLINMAQHQRNMAIIKKVAIGAAGTIGASALGREVWNSLE